MAVFASFRMHSKFTRLTVSSIFIHSSLNIYDHHSRIRCIHNHLKIFHNHLIMQPFKMKLKNIIPAYLIGLSAVQSDVIDCNPMGECSASTPKTCDPGEDCIIKCHRSQSCIGVTFNCPPTKKCQIECGSHSESSACIDIKIKQATDLKIIAIGSFAIINSVWNADSTQLICDGMLACLALTIQGKDISICATGHQALIGSTITALDRGDINLNCVGTPGLRIPYTCMDNQINALDAKSLDVTAMGNLAINSGSFTCPDVGECRFRLMVEQSAASAYEPVFGSKIIKGSEIQISCYKETSLGDLFVKCIGYSPAMIIGGNQCLLSSDAAGVVTCIGGSATSSERVIKSAGAQKPKSFDLCDPCQYKNINPQPQKVRIKKVYINKKSHDNCCPVRRYSWRTSSRRYSH